MSLGGGSACWGLIVSMPASEKISLEQIRAFLEGSDGVQFEAENREQLYGWVDRTLREQDYEHLARQSKGLVRLYMAKMTGMSRAPVTRLIGVYLNGGAVAARSYRRRRFPTRYTPEDVERLAAVDEAHETLSGPATQKILYREFQDYGDQRYERLA